MPRPGRPGGSARDSCDGGSGPRRHRRRSVGVAGLVEGQSSVHLGECAGHPSGGQGQAPDAIVGRCRGEAPSDTAGSVPTGTTSPHPCTQPTSPPRLTDLERTVPPTLATRIVKHERTSHQPHRRAPGTNRLQPTNRRGMLVKHNLSSASFTSRDTTNPVGFGSLSSKRILRDNTGDT